MTCLDDIHPARGLAYIRRVTTEDRYRGGAILIPDSVRDKVSAQQFVITSLGDYEICEDEDCRWSHTKVANEHRHRLKLSDWVLVRNRAWLASPDPDTYIVRVRDILGVFEET